ncbi:CPBP family glutamic-type intramembrane protease [Desulfogranum mediterraneum]|uniref:CPBP family glutamic-type intramembrane protease n=1 Tax=Desulfogranum mediterraneum TaxID=160661 RepID=UPI001E60AEBA|nr:CPBP family glutamic-type intramembrane protease [Desulfogranum mediterraneum]
MMRQTSKQPRAEQAPGTGMTTNQRLLLPYIAPYLAYVLISSTLAETIPIELNYLLRIVITTALLAWGWRWYIPLVQKKSISSSLLIGTLTGLAGCALWILCLLPFTDAASAAPWTSTGFLLRLSAAGLLVPVFEELMIHGFAFRMALQWDQCRRQGLEAPLQEALHNRSIDQVKPGQWSWMAVAISTLVFVSGHASQEWPAAIAYGLLMAWLLIRQRDLLACIIAHGITNISLAGYIAATGSWQLW